jgi:methionyl aminopeptidase
MIMQRSRRTIILKSAREIDIMREANRHTAEVLAMMCEAAKPGMSTWDLDQIAREEIDKRPVTSAFLGYYGYPAVVCVSINEEVVHGIPRKDKVIRDGDIVSIDFGLCFEGYVGDTARSIGVGTLSTEAEDLIRVTRECLDQAIALCDPEHRLSDIGKAVETHAQNHHYGVVREFVGHGIGTRMHEEPQVPNYYEGLKPRLRPGLVIAIEPMINMGSYEVRVLDDDWTAVTKDGSWSAHFEDSVAILEDGPVVLSRI